MTPTYEKSWTGQSWGEAFFESGASLEYARERLYETYLVTVLWPGVLELDVEILVKVVLHEVDKVVVLLL